MSELRKTIHGDNNGLCAGRRLLSASVTLTGRKQTDWLLGNASEGILERTQIRNV